MTIFHCSLSRLHKTGLSSSHHFESFTIATMSVMEYLCHKRPSKCTTCRKYFPVIFSLTYHRICNYVYTTGVTIGAGYTCPFLSVCTFVRFPLVIVLSVLIRFTDYDYLPFVSSNCSFDCTYHCYDHNFYFPSQCTTYELNLYSAPTCLIRPYLTALLKGRIRQF